VDLLYVVVAYRDDAQLKDMLVSVAKVTPKAAVIVVNNHYSDESTRRIEQLCSEFGCLLIQNTNTGYGPANNVGIKKALEMYEFRYLVVSNPDIVVENLDLAILNAYEGKIIGPRIMTPDGKSQNPYQWKDSIFIPYFLRLFAHSDIYTFSYLVSIHKAVTGWLMKPVRGKTSYDVYSLHGCFFVVSRSALDKLLPLFNDEMFLFGEEDYIAKRAKKVGVCSVYVPSLSVVHHRHGSLQFSNLNLRRIMRDSILKVYED
jgi:GT2 family glycosyltransferase